MSLYGWGVHFMKGEIIAIVGYPNSGKTTIFNFLTQKTAHVGNWEGVTVNADFCTILLPGATKGCGTAKTMVDLPGIRTLTEYAKQQNNCSFSHCARKCCSGCTAHNVKSSNNAINSTRACNMHNYDFYKRDELETLDFLLHNKIDSLINVVDATRLERDLQLTVQLLEMGFSMLVVLNKMDVARKHGISINAQMLGEKLGCQVLAVNAKDTSSLFCIRATLETPIDARKTSTPSPSIHQRLQYPHYLSEYNKKIAVISEHKSTLLKALILDKYDDYLEKGMAHKGQSSKFVHIKYKGAEYHAISTILHVLERKSNNTINVHPVQLLESIIAKYVRTLYAQVVTTDSSNATTHSSHITLDDVVLSKWFAIPVFLLLLQLVLFLTISCGTYLQAIIDSSLRFFFHTYCGQHLQKFVADVAHHITSIGLILAVLHGILIGLRTLFSFIPIIWILYFLLAILEDSGYIARVVLVVDRVFKKFGFSGRTVISLILGCGCNVQGVLSARSITTRKQRIITAMMVPFIPCSARLAVFTVFCNIFFPQHRIVVITSLYLCSCVLSIGTGNMLHSCTTTTTPHHTDCSYTTYCHTQYCDEWELPHYNWPHWRYVFDATTNKMREFIANIWRVLLLLSVVMNLLNAVNICDSNHPQIGAECTVIGNLASFVTPSLRTLGIEEDNWQATVGLVSGTFAKEGILSSLSSLYGLEHKTPNDVSVVGSQSHEWQDIMRAKFKNDANVVAYLLFVLFYFPCFAVFISIKNELGCKYALFSAIFTTSCAYACSSLFYYFSNITNTHEMNIWMIMNMFMSVALILYMFRLIIWISSILPHSN